MTGVVITGYGCVTPCGRDAVDTWDAVIAGRSGVRPITRFPIHGAATRVGGFVPGFEDSDPADESLAVLFGNEAAAAAMATAGLSPADEAVDVAIVANHGERRAPSLDNPSGLLIGMADMADTIGRGVGAKQSTGMYAACAAGGMAVAMGTELIRSGRADVVVAGGVDVLLRDFDFFQFCNLHAMTTRECPSEEACAPFDDRRDGFVLSEGAGFVVLESESSAKARGTEVQARVEGVGISQNAYHIVASPPDALGPTRAIESALRDSSVAPSAIGYVNAHGTSTRDNDWCETIAIRQAFGPAADDTMVSSTKSVMGHPMAAAGSIEIILALRALRTGVVPPTLNLVEPDPKCDLDYVPHEARNIALSHVASNSFGFGGHNTCIVLGQP